MRTIAAGAQIGGTQARATAVFGHPLYSVRDMWWVGRAHDQSFPGEVRRHGGGVTK